ncbi:MAG TPA: hypothetical protein VER79_11635 [Candidatus Limnocylindrales bacterium]|nr:hypothetical protein [Candidatus Limnocylindrales bacterium]
MMPTSRRRLLRLAAPAVIASLLLLAGCEAASLQVIPTARPTTTATPTGAPTRTPGRDATPSAAPTQPLAPPTGGPSPTPLFGQPAAVLPTPSRVVDPNAPRIEFFTTDVLSVAPGESLNLYWSTRNTTSANIYRIERGARNQLWAVGPDGSLTVPTRRADRGTVEFLLSVGDGAQTTELLLSVPVSCPDTWFFQPAPNDCPAGPARETRLLEQPFERGRMIYVEATDIVYALLNDGFSPAWIALDNRYDPAVHAESEPGFVPPAGFYQPVKELGFVWRGNDVIRNRLGLGIQPEFASLGFIQSFVTPQGDTTLYLSSADGSVLQLLPGGDQWQIINPTE